MTVVAYRDGMLAADRLVCDPWNIRAGYDTKIFKRNSAFYGFVGPRSEIEIYQHWLFAPDLKTIPTLNEGISCLCIKPDGIWRSGGKTPCLTKVEAPFAAIGTGAHIALGAMFMGASAEQAVYAAIALDTACGAPVDVLDCRAPAEAPAAASKSVAVGRPQEVELIGQINPNPIRDPYAEIMGLGYAPLAPHFGGPR
jgi:hypothetical protein